jgi:hypothetical protein
VLAEDSLSALWPPSGAPNVDSVIAWLMEKGGRRRYSTDRRALAELCVRELEFMKAVVRPPPRMR